MLYSTVHLYDRILFALFQKCCNYRNPHDWFTIKKLNSVKCIALNTARIATVPRLRTDGVYIVCQALSQAEFPDAIIQGSMV